MILMPKNKTCQNCGENPNDNFYECIVCFNELCDNCVNICRKCGQPLCDAHFPSHKKNCK